MRILFSKFINGEATHFKEKIAKGLHVEALNVNYNPFHPFKPKIHTIRRNEPELYDTGVQLEMFYNEGFEFILNADCTGIEQIFMTYHQGRFEVSIESKYLYYSDIEKLAFNDGFESYDSFKKYCIGKMGDSQNYAGFIIHWTKFKYT